MDTNNRVWVVFVNTLAKTTLLTKRSDKCNNAGQWGFPGGNVDPGEDLITAALRELEEETSVRLLPSDLEDAEICVDGAHTWFVISVKYSPRFAVTQEIDEYQWVSSLRNCGLDLHKSARKYIKFAA